MFTFVNMAKYKHVNKLYLQYVHTFKHLAYVYYFTFTDYKILDRHLDKLLVALFLIVL